MKTHPLKAERKLRKWSQAEVAEALGVSIQTVSRWERGQTIPHPYYRDKLSTLFGKTAEELGLISYADENDAVEEVASPITQSSAPDIPPQASFLANPIERISSRRVPIRSKMLLTFAVIITALVAFMVQPLYHNIYLGSSSDTSTMLTINMKTNFYGWTDNSPEGTVIADPIIHKSAGGVGTYSDPITFASSIDALKPGTIIYVPYLKKYVVMEDECSPCDSAWSNHHSYIIVIWLGGDANSSDDAEQSCENSLSRSSVSVQVHPPSNRVVDTTSLFTDSGGCIKL